MECILTVRQWLLQPVLDINTLEKRMDTIEYFQQSENYECLGELRDNLKYIKNTKRILKRIREATASMNDWVNLYKVRLN